MEHYKSFVEEGLHGPIPLELSTVRGYIHTSLRIVNVGRHLLPLRQKHHGAPAKKVVEITFVGRGLIRGL